MVAVEEEEKKKKRKPKENKLFDILYLIDYFI